METCQHCKMYMKPYITTDTDDVIRAVCEFCEKTIATKINGKWVKLLSTQEIK